MTNYQYYKQGDNIEIKIKSSSGEVIDTFKWNLNNKELEKKMYHIIKNKYGIFKPKEQEESSWIDKV